VPQRRRGHHRHGARHAHGQLDHLPGRKSNADLIAETPLTLDNFTGSTDALNLYGKTITMDEQWTSATLGGNLRTIGGTYPSNEAYNAVPGIWKPYGHFWTASNQNAAGRHDYTSNVFLNWDYAAYSGYVLSTLMTIVPNDAGTNSSVRLRSLHRSLWPSHVATAIDANWPSGAQEGGAFNYATVQLFSHNYPESSTTSGFEQENGYFEVRVLFPPQAHPIWPSCWFLFDDGWPPELDLFERFGLGYTGLHSTLHWPRLYGTGAASSVKTQEALEYVAPGGVDIATTGYHTVGVDWRGNVFRFYLDGKRYGTLDLTGRTDLVPDFIGRKAFWIQQIGVGGYIGNPDGTTPSDTSMYFDYNKVWT
jgi:hypothetical protein